MYDIKQRKELNNATVRDVINILSDLPVNTIVYFNGANVGYIHIEKDYSLVNFDSEDLEDDYFYDGQIED